MKLFSKNVDKDCKGSVTLIAENTDDIWHVYNVVRVGDTVRCATLRRVQSETATGSSSSSRVRTTLTLLAEGVVYDATSSSIQVRGRNVQENQFVKMGAYHTLDIEINRKFTLFKDSWDSVALGRIDTACDPAQNSELGAVIMHEGICNVCLITSSMTVVMAKIEQHIPRKHKLTSDQHDKGMKRFFNSILQALLRHVRLDLIKCLLIASPGFIKDHFLEWMMAEAHRQDLKQLIEARSKFLLVHSSSGFKHSLKEVLSDPSVCARLADTKALQEIKLIDTFFSMLGRQPDQAVYGPVHVCKALEMSAIQTLIVSDKLFRSDDFLERRKYVDIVDAANDSGSNVTIFSSMHVSGERLDSITGIAAILRYPISDLDLLAC